MEGRIDVYQEKVPPALEGLDPDHLLELLRAKILLSPPMTKVICTIFCNGGRFMHFYKIFDQIYYFLLTTPLTRESFTISSMYSDQPLPLIILYL